MGKIYTRTGDDGTTALGDGHRVPKDNPRIIAAGEIDELNSFIGLLLSSQRFPKNIKETLQRVQHELMEIGTVLSQHSIEPFPETFILRLENETDWLNQHLPTLTTFIIPGGNKLSALSHIARTVCRRCERSLVTLNRTEKINTNILPYMNRLSDLLFVIARYVLNDVDSE